MKDNKNEEVKIEDLSTELKNLILELKSSYNETRKSVMCHDYETAQFADGYETALEYSIESLENIVKKFNI